MVAMALDASEAQTLELPIQVKMVSLKRLKGIASKLGPRHPLRVIMLTEPDEIPWAEYTTKAKIWWMLLALKED